jgi:opacity protein-like surface antigen
MTKRMFVLGALLLMAFSTAALAADVTGKWKANFEGPMGSMEITYTFQASGEQLTGTVTNPMGGEDKIQEGKVKGDEMECTPKMRHEVKGPNTLKGERYGFGPTSLQPRPEGCGHARDRHWANGR